jgi:hypothetical protein
VVRGDRSATSAWTVRKNARKRWHSTSKAQRKKPQDRRTTGTQAARRGSRFRRVTAQPKTGSPQLRSRWRPLVPRRSPLHLASFWNFYIVRRVLTSAFQWCIKCYP